MTLIRCAVGLVMLFALSACSGGLNFLSSGNPEFDGLWTGRMQFTFGEAACPRRGTIRAEIRQGIVTATVRWPDGRGDMDGTIDADGILQGSEVSRKSFDFAELTGQFEDRAAEGRFKGKNCRGVWSLQKVKNL